jgi:hypothetical protein
VAVEAGPRTKTERRFRRPSCFGQIKAKGWTTGQFRAIYGDLEHYRASDSACRSAVLSYTSAWTKELHRLGYLAGIYANLSSGARHLSEAYTSAAYARLDALWIARWDGNSSLTGWAGIPDTQWASHQREAVPR